MFLRAKTIFSRVFSPSDNKVSDSNYTNSDNSLQANGLKISDILANSKKFEQLANNANRVLLKIRSVFPFDLFPDEITIDPVKVNIVTREFFLSSTIHSIYIKNILDVIVDCSPFFATLKIMYEGFGPNTVNVKFLKKDEAQKARRIIQGLAVAAKEGVDLTKLKTEDIISKAENIGSTANAYAL